MSKDIRESINILKKLLVEQIESRTPINSIEDARNSNTKPLKDEGDYELFVVKMVPKDGSDIYYDTKLLPNWVNIGGNYGHRNEIWVVEKF